jgi:hypothetical protein
MTEKLAELFDENASAKAPVRKVPRIAKRRLN